MKGKPTLLDKARAKIDRDLGDEGYAGRVQPSKRERPVWSALANTARPLYEWERARPQDVLLPQSAALPLLA